MAQLTTRRFNVQYEFEHDTLEDAVSQAVYDYDHGRAVAERITVGGVTIWDTAWEWGGVRAHDALEDMLGEARGLPGRGR